MSTQQATTPDLQIVYDRSADPHSGRPVRPEYFDRGAELMAQWALEDAT